MQIYHKVKVVLANLLYYKSNTSKLEKKGKTCLIYLDNHVSTYITRATLPIYSVAVFMAIL